MACESDSDVHPGIAKTGCTHTSRSWLISACEGALSRKPWKCRVTASRIVIPGTHDLGHLGALDQPESSDALRVLRVVRVVRVVLVVRVVRVVDKDTRGHERTRCDTM